MDEMHLKILIGAEVRQVLFANERCAQYVTQCVQHPILAFNVNETVANRQLCYCFSNAFEKTLKKLEHYAELELYAICTLHMYRD